MFSGPAQHIMLSPDAVDDPSSWTNLVQDHKRIRCPYCSVNAHVIQRQGKTWIEYYKGTRGFVTHLESHKDEFKKQKAKHARYGGSAGKTRRILDAAVRMTKEEEKAHQQHGNGHTSKYPHQLTISISRHLDLKDTSCASCRQRRQVSQLVEVSIRPSTTSPKRDIFVTLRSCTSEKYIT
jgi:hypothetical protein